jgi:steroid 5-alpha reductase family enzyme
VSAPAALALALGGGLAALAALWLVSLARRDASLVDIWWGPGFGALASIAWALAPDASPRGTLLLALVWAWGLRLGVYLAWRNLGKGEDPRYAAMRRRHGDRFGLVSLGTVFGLQGVLQWLVALPVLVAILVPGDRPLGALDAAGAALFAVGLAFETVGDLQLARFRADPANRGRVLDTGLWRWTRHPNYFGDCVVWWGLFAIAASTPQGPFLILSPLLMTFLLLRVSGVALLERSLQRTKPEYADYVARTSAFFPRPPRRSAP